MLRGKIKFWSEDGAEAKSLWSSKVGTSTIEELMYRSLTPIGLRIEERVAQRGKSTGALRQNNAAPRRPTDAEGSPSGMYFPPYLFTYARSAAAPLQTKQASHGVPDKEAAGVSAGTKYTSRVLFVLVDITPESAELWCSYFSRNRLTAVRLNGKALPLPPAVPAGTDQWLSVFCIRQGFRQGAKIANILEIDAQDLSPGASAERAPRFCFGLGGLWAPASTPPVEIPGGATGKEVKQ